MVTLSCSSTDSAITTHRWDVSVPGCGQLTTIMRTNTPPNTLRAAGTNCPSGIEFHFSRVSVSPFVSNLTTTTALDGTIVRCGVTGSTSSDVRITIAGNYSLSTGVNALS